MKFLLLRFALTPLLVFQIDEFIKKIGSHLFTFTLFLVKKFNNSDTKFFIILFA